MVKCPFCGFTNEDGALFCEQCKSDISGVAPTAPPASPSPGHEHPVAEEPIMAAVIEEEVAVIPVAPAMVPEAGAESAQVVEVHETIPVAVAQAVPSAHSEAPSVTAPVNAPLPPPTVPLPASPPPAPSKAVPGSVAPIPAGASPKLLVMRGLKINEEYNIFPGENFIGRADEKPVDVDLTFQEPEDRVWTSRQHALLVFDDTSGLLTIEDLNSANGTFVNRERVYPGQPKQLSVGSTIQIGTVHMRIKV